MGRVRSGMLVWFGLTMAVQAEPTKIVGIGAASCARFGADAAAQPAMERDYFAWAANPATDYSDAVRALYHRLRGPAS
jgi:hypothetical protein